MSSFKWLRNALTTGSMSVLMLALIFPGAWASDKPDQRPLRLGLLPYLSTEKLVKTYAPLANYLERQLKRKVIITTAPGFKEYLKRANLGRYDIFFTAPHFAALAEIRYKHSRLVRVARSLDGTIVVPVDSVIKKITDLRGRILSTPDRLAVITMLAEQLLVKNGLVPGRDVTIRYASSHNNAMKTVLDGLSDAAISLSALYDKMSPELKSRLRVLAKTPQIPHTMFMASGKLDKQTCEAIRQSLLAFGESPQGKLFFKNTGFVNFIKISDENMNTVMRFVPALEGRLK